MDKLSRTAAFVWAVVALGGCSALAGLDQIQVQACAPDCDGGTVDLPDGAFEASPTDDGGDTTDTGGATTHDAARDATAGDATSRNDGSPVIDATQDVGDEPVGHDATADAPVITDTGVGPMDVSPVPEGSSCGPTNTVQNCGACGQSCASTSTSTSSASCSGTACTYQCNSGYLDCNASNGYDPDGCECNVTNSKNTAVCCETSCPVQHNDGLTEVGYPATVNFYDCNPVGSYSQALAQDACLNFVGSGFSSQCSMMACGSELTICALNQYQCACWEYSGPNVGKVAAAVGTTCYCPGNSSATTTSWN